MFKTHVSELVKGDSLYVENHYGDFELNTVVGVSRYHVTVSKQRFMKSSGWEILYWPSRKDLLSGKRNKHRIHFGDGKLFTQALVDHYSRAQRIERYRTELIYTALRTSPVLWRNLSTEQLEQINQWLKGTE